MGPFGPAFPLSGADNQSFRLDCGHLGPSDDCGRLLDTLGTFGHFGNVQIACLGVLLFVLSGILGKYSKVENSLDY